jgi:hypothetical protein
LKCNEELAKGGHFARALRLGKGGHIEAMVVLKILALNGLHIITAIQIEQVNIQPDIQPEFAPFIVPHLIYISMKRSPWINHSTVLGMILSTALSLDSTPTLPNPEKPTQM